ncbi:MAG TPA: hypothetical protein VFR67_24605, partial [Pilimelia sp.]|nr:hypothetical protein [Pilimelia sp.]
RRAECRQPPVPASTTTAAGQPVKAEDATISQGLAESSLAGFSGTTVPLNAGANTIRATASTAAGGPNVDYLEVG